MGTSLFAEIDECRGEQRFHVLGFHSVCVFGAGVADRRSIDIDERAGLVEQDLCPVPASAVLGLVPVLRSALAVRFVTIAVVDWRFAVLGSRCSRRGC